MEEKLLFSDMMKDRSKTLKLPFSSGRSSMKLGEDILKQASELEDNIDMH